ncbi:hypothetical protein MHB63_11785 [Bacillus sp. FSL H8-0547]
MTRKPKAKRILILLLAIQMLIFNAGLLTGNAEGQAIMRPELPLCRLLHP